MKHFNDNIICAVDLETTGLRWGEHDIWQMCVMPVTMDFKPSQTLPFFHIYLAPRYNNIDPELPSGFRNRIVEAWSNGIDSWTAIDRFREWFDKLGLPPKKKIVPLGCNYANFDRNFMIDWLGGPLSYEEFFRSDSRDVQSAALIFNDLFGWHSEPVPFPKVNLSYLCNCLKIKREGNHDAVLDCVATIEVYHRMMRLKDHWSPI